MISNFKAYAESKAQRKLQEEAVRRSWSAFSPLKDPQLEAADLQLLAFLTNIHAEISTIPV